MKNIFHINAHEEYAFSLETEPLSHRLGRRTPRRYGLRGQNPSMKDDYDIDAEIAKHQWADAIFLQSPVNWKWAFLGHSRNTWTKFTHLGWMDVYVMGMVEHLKTPPFNTVKAEL